MTEVCCNSNVAAEPPISTPISNATPIPLRMAVAVWLRIGLLSFGGPAGQIALMHKELVERRRWVDEARFLHALNYCMLLPGPEAQQLAVYLGWLMHRTLGGVVAGVLFIAPGLLSMMMLCALYATAGAVAWLQLVYLGVRAAVVVLVLEALHRMALRACKTRLHRGIAILAAVATAGLAVPFPVVVALALLVGVIAARRARADATPPVLADDRETVIAGMALRGELAHTQPSLGRALRVLSAGVALWFAPLLAIGWLDGTDSMLWHQGWFFCQAAVLTFGGAYAVLSYVAQYAVVDHQWLRPREMLDGIAMAESTPGPLILVVQFVAFMAAYRYGASSPGAMASMTPMVGGILSALLVIWVTFVPSFMWIFLGGPYVESLRKKPAVNAALGCVSAAVVGVIGKLALWFALHTCFTDATIWHRWPLQIDVPSGQVVWPSLGMIAIVVVARRWRVRSAMMLLALGIALGLGWMTLVLGVGLR